MFNKPSIKVRETQEYLNVFETPRLRLLGYRIDSAWIHTYARATDNKVEKFYLGYRTLAFLKTHVALEFPQPLEDRLHAFDVGFPVLGIDEDLV